MLRARRTSRWPAARSPASAAPAGTVATLGEPVELTAGLEAPWGLTFLPDGSALVSERISGEILRIPPGGGAPRTVGVVPGVRVSSEGGLLGIAASPGFATDRTVFASVSGDDQNRVVALTIADGYGSLTMDRVLLDGIQTADRHHGGRIVVGPDGHLWIGTGDAFEPENAATDESLNGKILRVAVDGSIPDDNPGSSPIYSSGHRNVQGIAFGPDGTPYASELGHRTWDEVNVLRAGADYGWPETEGIDGGIDGGIGRIAGSTGGLRSPPSTPTRRAPRAWRTPGSLWIGALGGGSASGSFPSRAAPRRRTRSPTSRPTTAGSAPSRSPPTERCGSSRRTPTAPPGAARPTPTATTASCAWEVERPALDRHAASRPPLPRRAPRTPCAPAGLRGAPDAVRGRPGRRRACPASRRPTPASRTAPPGPGPRRAGRLVGGEQRGDARGERLRASPARPPRTARRSPAAPTTRNHHRRAAGQRLQRRQPERLVRAGGERDVGRRQQPRPAASGRGRSRGTSPAARPPGAPGRPGAARRPATTSRTRCPAARKAATVSMLRSGCFSGESRPQCTSRASAPAASPGAARGRGAAGENAVEVDPERDLRHVARPDPVELGPGERGRAHDGVVGGGHPGVRPVGAPAGPRPGQQELGEQPVEPLVGNRPRSARRAGPPTRPRPRSVSRSDTSIASGRSRSSNRCTRHGSTAR